MNKGPAADRRALPVQQIDHRAGRDPGTTRNIGGERSDPETTAVEQIGLLEDAQLQPAEA